MVKKFYIRFIFYFIFHILFYTREERAVFLIHYTFNFLTGSIVLFLHAMLTTLLEIFLVEKLLQDKLSPVQIFAKFCEGNHHELTNRHILSDNVAGKKKGSQYLPVQVIVFQKKVTG